MKVVFSSNILERSSSGTVTAGVWLELDGKAFPVEGWDDFASAFLSAIVQAALRIHRGSHDEIVRFFEGSYVVQILSGGRGFVRILGRENGVQGTVLRDEVATWRIFARSICDAGEKLLELCAEKGWRGDDEQALEVLLLELRIAHDAN